MRILDSHLHLWDPEIMDYPWLDGPLLRRFALEELVDLSLRGATRRAYVFVEADCVLVDAVREVAWAQSLSALAPIVAIVAQVALERGVSAADDLARLADHQLVTGVRRILQGSPGLAATADFVAGARLAGARSLSFNACISSGQIPEVAQLASAVPELTIVLDHLGKPPVGSARRPLAPHETSWATDLRGLARHPNVFCKFSGLPGESSGGWSSDQLAPFLDVAFDAFGPDRVMYASDWPASFRRDPLAAHADGGPAAWERFVGSWANDRLGAAEVDALFWTNSARIYRVAAV